MWYLGLKKRKEQRLAMSWMRVRKTEWRVAELALLLAANIGPWTFDVINVPSQYPCSAPNIRLEGDYCGMPLSLILLLFSMAAGFVSLVGGMATGNATLGDLSFVLLALLLVLPFFSTLLLILRGNRRRLQVLDIAAWALAFAIALPLAISSHPRLFWVLWGVWLYAGLAASALVLEVLTLEFRTRPGRV